MFVLHLEHSRGIPAGIVSRWRNSKGFCEFFEDKIINLEKYPINDIGSLKYKELTNYTRKQLNEDGCCVLPNFIKPDSIRKMKDEVDRNLSKIYFTSDKHNPYFTKDDKTLHEEHPKRIFTVRQSGYLNSDDLEKDSDLDKFYDLEEMLKFVSDSLEVFPLYTWADPLGKNPYSVMHTDHYFPWHFDGNEFTLSILIQKIIYLAHPFRIS